MDPAMVTWSHATNNRAELDRVLSRGSGVNFIEADIVLPPHDGAEPIMAHPPATTSDLSFRDFIELVVARADRALGLKLDFKSPGAVEPCLDVLAVRLRATANDAGKAVAASAETAAAAASAVAAPAAAAAMPPPPLWLNADIWQGPGGAPSPFDAATFVAQCVRLLKQGHCGRPLTLSPGWTTGGTTAPYTLAHVEQALKSLRRLGVIQAATGGGGGGGSGGAATEGPTAQAAAAAPAAATTTTTKGPQCAKDDTVECLWRGKWVTGRVVCLNNTRDPPEEWADDDTVNVQLALGMNDYATGLHPHEVRVLKPLRVGQRVTALQNGGMWGNKDFVPGRVVRVRKGNKYDVEFDDTTHGDVEQLVERSFIRVAAEEAATTTTATTAEPGDSAAPALPTTSSTDGGGGAARAAALPPPAAAVAVTALESALCPVTFPVKACLAAAADRAVWRALLGACGDFTLTVWGAAGEMEHAWISSMADEFPRRVYVDVRPAS